MVRWNWDILEGYIAPDLRHCNAPCIPAIPDMPNYSGSFMLNSVFVAKLPDTYLRMIGIFIRRVEIAVKCYGNSIDPIMDFSSNIDNQKVGLYLRSLHELENCVINMHIASCCMGSMLKHIKKDRHFIKGDKSDYDRLRELSNRIKHFDEDITDEDAPSAPVWLPNAGLACSTCTLEYHELYDILICAIEDARGFSEQFFDDFKKFNRPNGQ